MQHTPERFGVAIGVDRFLRDGYVHLQSLRFDQLIIEKNAVPACFAEIDFGQWDGTIPDSSRARSKN
ncbi:hypothetical protein D3C85_1700610 [compost metagenome]